MSLGQRIQLICEFCVTAKLSDILVQVSSVERRGGGAVEAHFDQVEAHLDQEIFVRPLGVSSKPQWHTIIVMHLLAPKLGRRRK